MLMGYSKLQRVVFVIALSTAEWMESLTAMQQQNCLPYNIQWSKRSTLYIDWDLKSFFNRTCCSLCGKKGVLSKALSGVKFNVIFHAIKIIFFWDVMWHTLQVEVADSSEMSVLSLHGIPSRKTTFECICVYLLGIVHFFLMYQTTWCHIPVDSCISICFPDATLSFI